MKSSPYILPYVLSLALHAGVIAAIGTLYSGASAPELRTHATIEIEFVAAAEPPSPRPSLSVSNDEVTVPSAPQKVSPAEIPASKPDIPAETIEPAPTKPENAPKPAPETDASPTEIVATSAPHEELQPSTEITQTAPHDVIQQARANDVEGDHTASARATYVATPTYPRSARKKGQEGRVVLSAKIGTSGEILHAHIAESSGHALLDKAALKAMRKSRFHPATRAGIPTPSTARLAFRFRLHEDR